MTSRLYVRKGGDIGAGDIELTGFTGRKGIPFFDDDASLIKMGMRCENGEASQGTFKLMDPEAELPRTDFEFNLPAHTLVTWTEDAPGAEIWLSRGRIAQYEGGRGDVTLDNQVEFDGLVDDGNMELRGQAFTAAWVRPQETDFDRIAALRAYTLNGSGSTATEHRDTASVTVSNTHLCPNTNTVSMPAKTYPVGTQPQDVITDCADTAGKIYGVVIHHTGGSHLCLLYILETDHSTYATAAKISDELADWDPEDATAPVYEPHWEAGKASIYDGQPLLSGLVSIYGTDQSVFVDNANATPYDYWTESYYDSQSVTPTQAATKASALLLYRSLTHVTHRVSIIMLASQLDLIHAGMSIQIKSAAAMGGQFLNTYQTRRIAECQFEPIYDGRYWAHLSLDRTPHTPKGGKVQPAATSGQPAPILPPPAAATEVYRWSFTTDTLDDATSTYPAGITRSTAPGSLACPFPPYGYSHSSARESPNLPWNDTDVVSISMRVWLKFNVQTSTFKIRFEDGGVPLETWTVWTGAGLSGSTDYTLGGSHTPPAGTDSITMLFPPGLSYASDDIVISIAGAAQDVDPFALPAVTGTSPYFARSDDPRFTTNDQHLTSRLSRAMLNNEGAALAVGDAVIGDETTDNAVVSTTTAAVTDRMVGIAVTEGDDQDDITVLWSGVVAMTPNTGGAPVAAGDFFYSSTVAGEFDVSAIRSAGAVGRAVTVNADDEAVVVEWWGVPDALDAATLSAVSATQRDISGNHRYPLWAHRGDIGSADSYPEQTIEALRQAILKGCEGTECDFWITSDGVWYSMHDESVARTTNGTGGVSTKTAAQMDALVIDGGFGYDAGRHAALSLRPPSLAAVVAALEPYDGILKAQIKTTDQAEVESFAQAIIDLDYVSRTIIEVNTHAFCGAVKAISPALTTMVNGATSGNTDADWGSYEASGISNLAYSTSRAPRRIGAYVSIDDYGASETTWFANAFARGASSFQTQNVDAALLLRKTLMYGGIDHGSATDLLADDHTQYVRKAVLTTKGDLFAATAAATVAALAVGANDTVLTADSSVGTGMVWRVSSGGSGELLMQDGVSSPPIPIETEDGTDWLYEG